MIYCNVHINQTSYKVTLRYTKILRSSCSLHFKKLKVSLPVSLHSRQIYVWRSLKSCPCNHGIPSETGLVTALHETAQICGRYLILGGGPQRIASEKPMAGCYPLTSAFQRGWDPIDWLLLGGEHLNIMIQNHQSSKYLAALPNIS